MSDTPDEYGTLPMLEVPEAYRPPTRPLPALVVWGGYTGKRQSCFDCLSNIATGLNRHFAEPARMTRTSREGIGYYCGRHGSERKIQDDMNGLTKKVKR